jgi:predicted nucleic acid-binding protein
MRAYIDSDILIWHLRREREALDFLRRMRKDPRNILCLGALQRAEIVFFMKPHERKDTLLLLILFETAPIDSGIVDLGGELYHEFHPAHGIDIADALLAATVMKTGGKIYTLNVKHFPMKDLIIERAWQ